ncbi:MAG: DUF3667 domain-containing protein [Acidobacteriia bacterium]|nr:DUF3667 domain-containing protein [Terriglobia bacterium]
MCSNCGQELIGEYCHHCGEQKVNSHDLALKHFFLHALHELTHLDSKVFATLRYLFTRPGFLTQEFVAGRRSRYMKPLSLFLIASALFLIVSSFVMISAFDVHQALKADKSGQAEAAFEKLATKKHLPNEVIVDRIQDTVHKAATAAQLANVLAMALLLALLFRGRYFVEHLVFSLHFLSLIYLATVLISPLYAIVARGTWPFIALSVTPKIVFCVYLVIGLRRVYLESMTASVVKAIVAYAITQVAIILTQVIVMAVAVVRAAML